MARALISFGARSLIYLFAFFPLFYLAYKFHVPDFGGTDYAHYHAMYLSPLDFSAADAPWVLRQIQAVLVNLLYEAGFDYDTDIAFAATGYERGVFFSALTVNYLSVTLTAALLGTYLHRQTRQAELVSWWIPAVMVFNFSILFFAFSGLTEGLSLLMFTAAYLAYRAGLPLIAALIILAAALQRELIPILFVALVFVDLITGGQHKQKSRLLVLASATLSLCAHIALRLSLSNDQYGHQLSPQSLIDALAGFSFGNREFIFQVFLTQNLAIIVLLATVMFMVATRRAPRVDRWLTRDLCVTFGVILFVGIAAAVGNNIGRLLIFCSPVLTIILASIAREWSSVLTAPIHRVPPASGPPA
ncbi:hypothetical protein ANTHELSMS3_01419 [Antarctobacter heliothermus]|uniref:EpsG family protein n=1 Tax=Antarctobacter heliothermus TaxID=74033 RepID=A0A222E2B6_9RHOB|nr:hypothetical protein [Antarctobacter heliothermus]ASP20118.1 hypothetical protein ANTHELSMS3_01419 [Antarctobacter heliothermus]